MAQTTDFLMYFRRIIKLHESMLKEICETYQDVYKRQLLLSVPYRPS